MINPQDILSNLQKKAKETLDNPELIKNLLKLADSKTEKHANSLKEAREDFKTLSEMIRAYASGSYTKLPWKTLLTAIATLIYFVNPLDAIPDFIIGTGFIDDLSVLAFALSSLKSDIKAFRDFRSESTPPED